MTQIASQTLREQVDRIMKQAEAEAEGKCSKCGEELSNGKCPECDKGGKEKESNLAMGYGGDAGMSDAGMDVTAAADLPFVQQLTKLAEAVRYCGENLPSLDITAGTHHRRHCGHRPAPVRMRE